MRMRDRLSTVTHRRGAVLTMALCLIANFAAPLAMAQQSSSPTPTLPGNSGPTVYRATPGQPLRTVTAKIKAGDRVIFAPGTYRDCAVWSQNGLQLRAETPGTAIFDGVSCQGKAIFVISGENVSVDGIVFKNAAVPDKNGAGIRAEGRGLSVSRSRFIRNENGILSRSGLGGTLSISSSYFDGNGKCAPACAHGIYINEVDLLRISASRFINTRDGHHIKSRALRTVITDTSIDDGPAGNSSYLIELPNGGSLIMSGNRLIKGPVTSNSSSFIAYGFEGLRYTGAVVQLDRNSFINSLSRPVWMLMMARGSPTPQLIGNTQSGSFAGPVLVR